MKKRDSSGLSGMLPQIETRSTHALSPKLGWEEESGTGVGLEAALTESLSGKVVNRPATILMS